MKKLLALLLVILVAGERRIEAQEKPFYKKGVISIGPSHMTLKTPGQDAPKHMEGFNLLLDGIMYGAQLEKPVSKHDYGNPNVDFSRLATTYYHRSTPIGIALEKFNWFGGPMNTFTSDARLPASLLAALAQNRGLYALTMLWSEPPVGVIGLNMGTLASYARPLQTWHFVEHYPDLIKICREPIDGKRYFYFVDDALKRGAQIQMQPGEGRKELAKGPDHFYHMLIVEAILKGNEQTLRESLLTREGMKLCMDKLVTSGILCYHTSCRYYQLDQQVSSTANSLGYAFITGRNPYNRDREDGSFSCQWVMVARNQEDLKHLTEPPNLPNPAEKFWTTSECRDRFVWSDGKINYQGLYYGDPYLVRRLRNAYYALNSYLPSSLARSPAFQNVVNGFLRTLDDLRLRSLNAPPSDGAQ